MFPYELSPLRRHLQGNDRENTLGWHLLLPVQQKPRNMNKSEGGDGPGPLFPLALPLSITTLIPLRML